MLAGTRLRTRSRLLWVVSAVVAGSLGALPLLAGNPDRPVAYQVILWGVLVLPFVLAAVGLRPRFNPGRRSLVRVSAVSFLLTLACVFVSQWVLAASPPALYAVVLANGVLAYAAVQVVNLFGGGT